MTAVNLIHRHDVVNAPRLDFGALGVRASSEAHPITSQEHLAVRYVQNTMAKYVCNGIADI